MEMLKNTKRDRYAKTQNLRDEDGALDHLETAGDILIKDLAKKQISKITSLDEQLRIRQDFEKGADLEPWNQTGLSSLERFKSCLKSEEATPSTARSVDYSLESIKNRSGLTRHELELGTVEKPGSQSSKLYKFALGNLRARKGADPAPDGHPLNRLKEIEEEVFGKKAEDDKADEPTKKKRRKKRKRKRPKKASTDGEEEVKAKEVKEDLEIRKEAETKSYRPSLWDVRDMKKLCRKGKPGCEAPRVYTVKDGKIVELGPCGSNS